MLSTITFKLVISVACKKRIKYLYMKEIYLIIFLVLFSYILQATIEANVYINDFLLQLLMLKPRLIFL